MWLNGRYVFVLNGAVLLVLGGDDRVTRLMLPSGQVGSIVDFSKWTEVL